MIVLGACPKCKGPVIHDRESSEDYPLCIMCGWRPRRVPRAVREEIHTHLGKTSLKHPYEHKNPMRGKPPLSGWEREKRRRQAPKQRAEEEGPSKEREGA